MGPLCTPYKLSDQTFTDHVRFHLRSHPNQHVERSCDIESIAESETYKTWIDGSFGHDGKESSKQSDEVTNTLKPHGEPPTGDKTGVIANLVGVNSSLVLLDEGRDPTVGTYGGSACDCLREVSVDRGESQQLKMEPKVAVSGIQYIAAPQITPLLILFKAYLILSYLV